MNDDNKELIKDINILRQKNLAKCNFILSSVWNSLGVLMFMDFCVRAKLNISPMPTFSAILVAIDTWEGYNYMQDAKENVEEIKRLILK